MSASAKTAERTRSTAPQRPGEPAPATKPARTPLPWLLPIRPLQAAVWEIAAIAALLAWTVAGLVQPVRIGISVVAGLVVALTSVRLAGRHPAGWALTWLAYRLRRRDRRDGSREDSTDALHHVAGAVKVRQHVDRAGNRFGVAEIDGGWSAIVRLTPGTGRAPDPAALAEILRAAYRRTDVPLASAQLLTWAVPRGDQVLRVRWLAVRYRPDEAPIAALARGGGDLGALRSTASAALSLMGELAEAGYPSTVLEAGELDRELRVALGVQGPRGDGPTTGWRAWTWGEATQMCFTPRSAATLEAAVPGAAFTATSYTLRRTASGKQSEEVTIRVGARPGAPVPEPPSAVALHGHHDSGIRRTLPLALDA